MVILVVTKLLKQLAITLTTMIASLVLHASNLPVPKQSLWDEIDERLFNAEIKLIDFPVPEFATVFPKPQDIATVPIYFPRRTLMPAIWMRNVVLRASSIRYGSVIQSDFRHFLNCRGKIQTYIREDQ